MKIILILILIFNIHYSTATAQSESTVTNTIPPNETTRIVPGKQFKAGILHKFFFGEHWRNLWTTEIDAEVIDLKTFANGLTPIKKGGGLQTKSLRLKGNDGNEYKFRLIEKSPEEALPPELRNSLYGDVIKDQISIGLPISSLITYPLMKETGILSAKPKIVIFPDDTDLGNFRKDFGGKPGIIEINPRAGKKGFNNFEGADKVINGFDIFKKTENDNDEQVDQKEFLKARLMDIFLGDRDRHADQWQWAGYKENGKRIWKPIPRDRDYAFGKYDGLFPWASQFLAHSLVGFNEDIPQIIEITWTGRHLDRRFLNKLGKRTYDSIANYLTYKLSDSILNIAVRTMPVEMYAESGEQLFLMLKNRRDQLVRAAEDFYKLSSAVVDIYGSNKKEFAEIKIINKKELEVSLYKRDKESGEKKGDPFYKRKFSSGYTDEIRLHLLDGDDIAFVKGKNDNDILLRIISGDGTDEVKNKSDLKIKLYDSNRNSKLNIINSIYLNDDIVNIPKENISRYEPQVEDRYGFPAFTPVLNFNTDDGYILGGGPNFTQFGFRSDPYLYFIELTGAYSTYAKDYDIRFYGDFNKLIHKSRVHIFLKASELDFNRFYGFGNETQRDEELAEKNFYKTNQQDYSIEAKVSVNISNNFHYDLGITYQFANVRQSGNSLVNNIKPYGSGKLSTVSLNAGFSFDNRNNSSFPESGAKIYFETLLYPQIFGSKSTFVKIRGDFLNYNTVKTFTDITLVLRAGGEVLTGDYPFYKGAALGGLKNLRGFSRERFLGDAMIFGQSELRVHLANLNLFFPSKIGISFLSDVGRVFVKGENSKKWHSTYGGGLWLNIIKAITLNFNVAVSPEVTRYYFSTGFTL
ncbi:MAG: BamA/TamA family outer membrane protein [Ignavibacteria bacterium]